MSEAYKFTEKVWKYPSVILSIIFPHSWQIESIGRITVEKKCLPIFRLSDFNLNNNGVVGTVLWATREVLTKCPISSPPEKGVITGAWESAR